jgi:hypothetical protein
LSGSNSLRRRITLLEVRAPQAALSRLPPRPLDRPQDVVELLAEQAEAVRQDVFADPLDRARTLALVAGLALRAMEAAGTRARLEAVERVLKLRRQEQRADATAAKQRRR